jgi:hypothetical protein
MCLDCRVAGHVATTTSPSPAGIVSHGRSGLGAETATPPLFHRFVSTSSPRAGRQVAMMESQRGTGEREQ